MWVPLMVLPPETLRRRLIKRESPLVGPLAGQALAQLPQHPGPLEKPSSRAPLFETKALSK
jgi:hypothetical protein